MDMLNIHVQYILAMRLKWVTAARAFIQEIDLHTSHIIRLTSYESFVYIIH